jgi:hypothetical protein
LFYRDRRTVYVFFSFDFLFKSVLFIQSPMIYMSNCIISLYKKLIKSLFCNSVKTYDSFTDIVESWILKLQSYCFKRFKKPLGLSKDSFWIPEEIGSLEMKSLKIIYYSYEFHRWCLHSFCCIVVKILDLKSPLLVMQEILSIFWANRNATNLGPSGTSPP